jgi:hypothetical protein
LLLAVIMNVAERSYILQPVQQSGTAMQRLLASWRVLDVLLRLVPTLIMRQSACLEFVLRTRQLQIWPGACTSSTQPTRRRLSG